MIPRSDLVGHRIKTIVGDSSLPEEAEELDIGDYSYTDFIYVADSGIGFRMPIGDPDEGDILPVAEVTLAHEHLQWLETDKDLDRNLWHATIDDIRIQRDVNDRYPDSGLIQLSSGWFLVQLCAGPPGIAPNVDIVSSVEGYDETISIWSPTVRSY